MHIIPMKIFKEKEERKVNGINFCQVSKVPITNHEIILDILISQKCIGPIPIFREIRTIIIKFVLLAFSSVIFFVIILQENKQIRRKADAKDWTKKYIRKDSFFFISSSDILMQINIIELISKIIHKKINEGFIIKMNGKKITIEVGSSLYINKKNNFQ